MCGSFNLYLFAGDIQLHEESNTIVLSASSNPRSRGRKLPLKLLKIKQKSQLRVSSEVLYMYFAEPKHFSLVFKVSWKLGHNIKLC